MLGDLYSEVPAHEASSVIWLRAKLQIATLWGFRPRARSDPAIRPISCPYMSRSATDWR